MSHRRTWKRRARGACVGLGLCLLWAGPSAAERARVAILPVVVHTANPDPTYVSRGISDMLSARLEQLGAVEIVRIDDPAAATSRLEPALQQGRSVQADFVLYGSFTQFGDGASLDIQCASVAATEPGHDRNIFIQSGSVGEIIPKLDQLADMVTRFVSGSDGSDGDSGSASIAAGGASSRDLEDLRERLEVLESLIFSPGAGAALGQDLEPAFPES